MDDSYVKLKVKLLGEDGNAFAIMGKVSRVLRKAGFGDETVGRYKKEAMSGNYDNLLRVTMKYVDVY